MNSANWARVLSWFYMSWATEALWTESNHTSKFTPVLLWYLPPVAQQEQKSHAGICWMWISVKLKIITTSKSTPAFHSKLSSVNHVSGSNHFRCHKLSNHHYLYSVSLHPWSFVEAACRIDAAALHVCGPRPPAHRWENIQAASRANMLRLPDTLHKTGSVIWQAQEECCY